MLQLQTAAAPSWSLRSGGERISLSHRKLGATLLYINIENFANSKTIKFRYFKVHKWPIHLYVEIVQFFNNLHEGQRIEQFETLSISDSSHVFYVTPIDVEQIHLIYLLTRLDEGKRNPNKLKQAF